MEPDMSLRSLIDMSTIPAVISEVLEGIDEDFEWLDEILTECRHTFVTASINLLPKTPSQKKVRKRAKRRLTDELETNTESENGAGSNQEQPGSTSETPVRPLRCTRSRAAQSSTSSTSSRVTRSSRATVKKLEDEKENMSTVVKASLPSVSESIEQASASPAKSVSLVNKNEGESFGVRSRARAYENMLSERNQGSPVTPKNAGSNTPKSASKETPVSASKETKSFSADVRSRDADPEMADPNVIDTSQSSRRSSVRRSGVAGKRKSLKVLGSKTRMRSQHGHLSRNGSFASIENQIVQECLKVVQQEPPQEKEDKISEDGRSTDPAREEPQEKAEVAETKSKATRTRLRLKKRDKSAETSESSSGSEPATEIDSESKPAGASRTKRKVQPLSSEEEPTNSKTSTDEASASEQEGRTRTRTKARKLEVTASQKETGTTPTVEVLKSAKDSTTVKKDNSSGSEGSDIDRRRTQTKSRKGDEQLVSKEFSSDEVVDTEGTDGSVFYSPTANSSLQSSRRLSGHSSVKSSSTVDSGASTKSVTDDARGVCAADSTSVSVAAPVTDSGDQDVVSKPEESSRRETRVIRRAETHANDSAEGAEEEALPARSTRTKTRQMQNKAAESEEPTRPQEDEPRMTRTKTRKRQAEEEAADTSASKKSCIETPPKTSEQPMDTNEEQEGDDDSDYEDIETDDAPSVQRTVPSFLNQLRKSSLSHSTNIVSGVVTSFLKRNTPTRKPTFQHMQEQKKKELLQKEKREQERLNRLESLKKNKAEENKRKREERMRKVAEMREMRQKKELDLKKTLAEKMQERLNSTDKLKEDRFKEEREKQRIRFKRQIEADERRRQEEEQRLRKLIEQQEEQKRYEEQLQRKREQEEQERQRRLAEERRRQEERAAEAERQRLAEMERLRQQELAREKERQREKEQKEKTAAQERAERERQELAKRKERELKIQKELELLKDLEQQRLARMVAQEEEKRKDEAKIEQIIQQHNRNLQNLGYTAALTLTNSTTTAAATKAVSKHQPNPDSYPISPVRVRKNGSLENYDIGDLRSDDSTDDDEAPRKKIPTWAQGANLKATLINQVYHPPDLDSIFSFIDPPDLSEMFDRKRARFFKRTSSAVWNSPLHKPL